MNSSSSLQSPSTTIQYSTLQQQQQQQPSVSIPPPPPPPPSGQSLCLVSALSNPENHELHIQAIKARDDALSSSSADTYGILCLQLLYIVIGSDSPQQLIYNRISVEDLNVWKQNDMSSVLRLQQDPTLWIPFGQMAGYILKNALLRPPHTTNNTYNTIDSVVIANHMKDALLYAIMYCQRKELRDVVSSIISTVAVSHIKIQPLLHVQSWTTLIPQLINMIHTNQNQQGLDGCFVTLRKMMEDGPNEFTMEQFDNLIPLLLQYISSDNTNEIYIITSLQIVSYIISNNNISMPNTLILQFNQYLQSLSTLVANHENSNDIRKWVCRNIVTLLELRTEYIRDHLQGIAQFMLQETAVVVSNNSTTEQYNDNKDVAIEACDFWLTYASLDEAVITGDMNDIMTSYLPSLVPILVRNMIYPLDMQYQLLQKNQLDYDEPSANGGMKPIFHKSKASIASHHQHHQHGTMSSNDEDDDNLDDDDDSIDNNNDDDEDGNEWTIRKCSAASLDSLANVFGGDVILPCLLPVLQDGLANTDPWVQEASILALGAVAEGCQEEMAQQNYMTQIHPYLLSILQVQPEQQSSTSGDGTAATTSSCLPQVQSIAAWTIGQYATWAIEQVQNGTQGHLLAHMTEIFLFRLSFEANEKVQYACCAAFGVIIEAAGDLMAPYLDHIYHSLVTGPLVRYTGRSLLTLIDIFGILADCCGPAIAEKNLPSIYIPPLLRMWDGFLTNDPTDRSLLPLMECLASIAVTCGMNFQPYALEAFENSMCIIEQVTLSLATFDNDNNGNGAHKVVSENEEDYDPIICSLDLLDGLVEGLGPNIPTLLSSNQRYGPQFLNVLLSMCQHDISGVRMSALALLGDLARNAPMILEPAIPQLLTEAIQSMDPINASVATNAVWAIGEICAKCDGNASLLEPFASSILQNLIGLLMGNGVDGGSTDIPGLAENASACVGRLAKVNANFVARDLPRFLLGWCDGMAKISNPTERRDAYQGFVQAVYANPQAIQEASVNVSDTIASILFAILTWHIPADISPNEISSALFVGEYNFQPFPTTESDLGAALMKLVHDIKSSVGDELWFTVEKKLPVNVRRLLREAYQL